MKNTPFYITTTLPYVNSDPHIGFALEIVQADILARYQRLLGNPVTFSTGTDEHGQKIYEAAQKSGQDVRTYVDHYASRFEKLKSALNLSYDRFIRTTDPLHVAAAEEMWRLCDKAGDIYKKEFEGLYCVGCEKYLTERDMENGLCVIHGKAPVVLKEENYFFRFSKYQDRLLEYLKQNESIVPEWRREEAIAFVQSGLEDFSISREKAKLSWGIPVPGDETQVMYVWFDALTNYISTLGWPNENGDFKTYWQDGFTLQLAGKDQVRFQSLMWQAMLFSAGVKNTNKVFYHGFITSAGKKMSKSLGNVIDPFSLVEEYGTDAVRYFLAREVSTFEDSDVTLERIREAYNANLANGIGNLASRIMKMAEANLEPIDGEGKILPGVADNLEKFEIQKATDVVWENVQILDQKIQTTEPFKLIKTSPDEAKIILRELVGTLRDIAASLVPFMPQTAENILSAIKINRKPENLFARK